MITKINNNETEIYRYIRPKFFNKKRGIIDTYNKGGIVILFVGKDKKYDFWINVVPDDAVFSNTMSKKILDNNRKLNASWGEVYVEDLLLLDHCILEIIEQSKNISSNIIAEKIIKILLTYEIAKEEYDNFYKK